MTVQLGGILLHFSCWHHVHIFSKVIKTLLVTPGIAHYIRVAALYNTGN